VPRWVAWAATGDRWGPTLRYAARGIAGLWLEGTPPATDEWVALAELVGETRARVLRHLVVPMTTREIARRCGITAGAASQHLTALTGAGLLARTRVGRRVYYEHSERGARVLEALRPSPGS
jgi:DNA-binding transcriptional ArsR family regulator